jgi:protein required for attachment to host cells
MKPTITYVLVADGAQAKIFEHLGPGKGLKAREDLIFSQDRLKASDIMSDRQGRTNTGVGRAAIDHGTDPVDQRERSFVTNLAGMLDDEQKKGGFSRLVIAADPTSLGHLRQAMSQAVRDTVLAELPKDLTGLPTLQLEKHFAEVLAV